MFKYDFKVPENKKYRVIVHTDCKNEADDQFALAHHLMTPKFIVKGIIAGHFDINAREYGKGNTATASYNEINKVLELMGIAGEYPVLLGAQSALPDMETPVDSQGARFIIEEAMKEDTHPLYVVFLGAITDLGAAILMEPRICDRMTAIWIGGGDYPKGGGEFNLVNDIKAANIVFSSQMPLWQIPINTYKQMAVSLAELQLRVKPFGKIGAYLFEQMVAFNYELAHYQAWPHGETWGLGDQASITVLLEELEKKDYDEVPAPFIRDDMTYEENNNNRLIRVYHTLNTRLTMEDFYAKLALNFSSNDD